jgi:hypothetical protein
MDARVGNEVRTGRIENSMTKIRSDTIDYQPDDRSKIRELVVDSLN